MTINIHDFEYADFWLDSGKTATHIARVFTLVNGVRNESDFHLFRVSNKYLIDIFGFRFRRSDGFNTGDNNVFIDLSTVTEVQYFKPTHSSSRGF